MKDGVIQKLVMIMDMHGYEQDGEGPVFVDMHSPTGLLKFADWEGVYEFVVSKFVK